MSATIPYCWTPHSDQPMSEYERSAEASGYRCIAGVDEAGRGPLAGPIVAAAVILSAPIPGVDDSKKLSEKKRDALYDIIRAGDHAVGVGIVSAEAIDHHGIQPANYKSMTDAALNLALRPDYLLVDGFTIKECPFEQRRIVKGDQLSQSIAAASVIAKVTRDRLMQDLDARYPEYGFAQHKGYGTKMHMEAIEVYGPCPAHRKTFAPISQYG
jgi:ribonuclease HII